ncbi:EamA family transporter [Intrasporangium sp. DVR]|uniref:EamA family transporter n=1 Tax=Intrasporangium sp. DVR TaxID=3127867 RepID=UPI00313A5D61
MTRARHRGLLLALATAVVSGVSVYVNSFGVKAISDASTYTTAKNLVAAAVLVVLLAAARPAGARLTRPSTTGHWLGLAYVGVLGGSVPFVLFFEGLQRAQAPQAAFLHKTLVLWVALLALVVLKERLSWLHWVAIGLLVGGQWALAGAGGLPSGSGALLILAATLLWSVETVVAKRLLVGVSSWTVGITRMGVGSLVLLGWLTVTGRLPGLGSLTGAQWRWVLVCGALLAAYVATWFAALARAQAVDVTAVLVLGAVITAAIDATVKGVLPANVPAYALLALGAGLIALTMIRRERVGAADPAGRPG